MWRVCRSRNVNEGKSSPSLLSYAQQIFQYNVIINRKRKVKAQPVAAKVRFNTQHDIYRELTDVSL